MAVRIPGIDLEEYYEQLGPIQPLIDDHRVTEVMFNGPPQVYVEVAGNNVIPAEERIVTIEDAAELQLHQEHVVRLESRPPDINSEGQIKIRDLVINALRMRPDRLIVGECRGGEALDMLQAMNTGHDGSMTT